ncbi:ABC-type glycerol-3-phosphate transport system substrate-binding protein [Kineococcus radiotolerans]|uniref:ABC-type glycerol-3-phosphate transport system substrate-binding protein n=1 Tax=Kineococcus radiotolerans TaxID=131568 RepID=A0A7W4TQM2_KINRA|nr:extracellular solute-binding protein [Kineococcus radiotolerans]MBB2903160.1 ABC-type glycerol-3-phosphate transport system substrate-binding protein [Kineococcus radiotolerans]
MKQPHRAVTSRRAFLHGGAALAAGVAGSAALTSCADTSYGPARSSGALDLAMWTHDPGYITTFTESAAQLSTTSPFQYDLQVTQSAAGDVMTRFINQAIVGKGTPDLTGIEVGQFNRVMRSDVAGDILIDWTEELEQYGEDLLRKQPYSVDGRVYAIESDTCLSIYWYREDEFAKNGLPTDLDTWEDLLEAGGALHQKTGQSLAMVGTGTPGDTASSLQQWLLQRGGGFFDQDGELILDSPETVETLDWMARGVANGTLINLPDAYGAPLAAALKQGQLIGTFMPNWYNAYGLQANVPDQKGLWRMRVAPRFTGGGHIASSSGGTGFAVTKDKVNTDGAQELLRATYLTREGQLLRYKAAGYLPTIKSLYSDPELLAIEDEYLGGQRVFEVLGEAAEDLPSFYQSPNYAILQSALAGPVQAALRGRTTAARAIADSVESYRKQART